MTDKTEMNTNELQTLLDAGGKLGGIGALITQLSHPSNSGITVPIAIVEDESGRHIEVLDDALQVLDQRLGGPQRRDNTVALTEEDSFIGAVKRWATSSAVIYAQTAGFSFQAMLDDHPAGPTGTAWRAHRVTYSCPRSNEWKIWTGAEVKNMSQLDFAEFIEQRLEDMVDPSKLAPEAKPDGTFPAPLDVLQVARNLQVFTKGTYSRSFDPTTGNYAFVNKNENETGSTVIPRTFLIAIPVFDGGDRYPIEARVRFALVEGSPRFSFTLHRRTEIERHAFDKVRAKVAEATGLPVFAGSP